MATILFFGRLGDASPTLEETLPETVKTVDALMKWLGQSNQRLAEELSRPGNRIAVNKTIVSSQASVSDNDEIAFMSPLSGG